MNFLTDQLYAYMEFLDQVSNILANGMIILVALYYLSKENV